MAESGWLRHSAQIGWFEFRRSVRSLRGNKGRLLMQIAYPVVLPLIFAILAIVFAGQLRSIEPFALPDGAAGYVSITWLFMVFMIANRTVSQRDGIESEPLMLTTVSSRTVAVGMVIAELLRALANMTGLILVATGVSALVFGSVAGLVVIPIAIFLLIGSLVVTGQAFGYATLLSLHRSPFLRQHKLVIGIPLGLIAGSAYPLLVMSGSADWMPVGFSDIAIFPVGWLVDLMVVGTPLVGSTSRMVGGLAFSGLIIAIGLPAITRLTAEYWFDEPVSDDSDDAAVQPTTPAPDARSSIGPLSVPTVFSQPTRRVAEWGLLRTVREPKRLVHLLLPLIFGFQIVQFGFQSGSLGQILAPACAVTVAILVGEIVAMNPLGDEGSMLSVTILAVSGTKFVRGLLVPGLLYGVPVGMLLTGLTAVISPYSITTILALVVTAGVLTVFSVAIAPAIGMALPRYSAISVGRSQEVRPPRMSAIVLHASAIGLPGSLLVAFVIDPEIARTGLAIGFGMLPALITGLLGWDGGASWFEGVANTIEALDLATAGAVGPVALVLGGLIAALLSYHFAIELFESYEFN
ncbi:hypothetical protein [Halocatena halophila]|uniref:hypothetical protein n=1 Tax=Halocatena halophila TaxID=2814576 RepID=UPI002ECFE8EA